MMMAIRAVLALVLGATVSLAAETTPAAPAGSATPAAEAENTGPQPFKNSGVVLTNPDNPKEAILLIQLNLPGKNGAMEAQQFGVPIKPDANGLKLIAEFGVKGVKPDDAEGAKKAQAEALLKFVQVEGILSEDANGEPLLTVSKYQKASLQPAAGSAPATPATGK